MAQTILIVDDSASLRQMIAISLRGAGYHVLEATDGRDALAMLTGQKVHLMVSDLNMPHMDGISFIKAVQQLPDYKLTPIVALTTETQQAKKKEVQEAGAKAWVTKPFTPDQLLGVVQKLVLQ